MTIHQPGTLPEYQLEELRSLRHELRTPVNHIIGYSEMLLEDAEQADEAQLVDTLQSIHRSGRELLHSISDMLAMDHVATYGVDFEQLEQRLQTPLNHIITDIQLLEMVDSSLNAQFATDLQRIGNAARHLGGLVAARFATSQARELPWQPATTVTQPEILEPQIEHGNLLVVDDDENNCDLLARTLQHFGYTVTIATSGTQALELIRQQPIDLVLLDVMMPEIDGFEVLQRFKQDPQLNPIPVIMLSAAADTVSLAQCIRLGAEDYLAKPVDHTLLRARINSSLQKKIAHDMQMSYLDKIRREKQRADRLLEVVIPLGVELADEKDFQRLLEKIVVAAQKLCNADGGSLYLRSEQEQLEWVIVRNSSLGVALGGTTGQPITFAPLDLYEHGHPNHQYVVTHAALTGTTINVANAYEAEGFDFSGTKAFDERTNYRSISFVNVPLKGADQHVIGVLQLINAKNPETGDVVRFDRNMQQTVESLSALASVALAAYAREQRLQQQITALKIEIDEVRKQHQVQEITETDYFQSLQDKVRHLRKRNSTPN
jgi:CheY-like chemotaxis protein